MNQKSNYREMTTTNKSKSIPCSLSASHRQRLNKFRPIKAESASCEDEIKDYAKTTMNELLGWYGYEKFDSRETQRLNLKNYVNCNPIEGSSQATSLAYEILRQKIIRSGLPIINSGQSKESHNDDEDDEDSNDDFNGNNQQEETRHDNEIEVSSRSLSETGIDNTDQQQNQPNEESRESDTNGDLTMNATGSSTLPSINIPEGSILCAWCQKIGSKMFTLRTTNGFKAFCSELCFAQCRRASFKKNKVCDWCKHVRHTVNYVDFQEGEQTLQFCSDKCLNQYKMNIFCKETQAHLNSLASASSPSSGQSASILTGAPESGSSSLITPDLWLRNHHNLLTKSKSKLCPSTSSPLPSPSYVAETPSPPLSPTNFGVPNISSERGQHRSFDTCRENYSEESSLDKSSSSNDKESDEVAEPCEMVLKRLKSDRVKHNELNCKSGHCHHQQQTQQDQYHHHYHHPKVKIDSDAPVKRIKDSSFHNKSIINQEKNGPLAGNSCSNYGDLSSNHSDGTKSHRSTEKPTINLTGVTSNHHSIFSTFGSPLSNRDKQQTNINRSMFPMTSSHVFPPLQGGPPPPPPPPPYPPFLSPSHMEFFRLRGFNPAMRHGLPMMPFNPFVAGLNRPNPFPIPNHHAPHLPSFHRPGSHPNSQGHHHPLSFAHTSSALPPSSSPFIGPGHQPNLPQLTVTIPHPLLLPIPMPIPLPFPFPIDLSSNGISTKSLLATHEKAIQVDDKNFLEFTKKLKPNYCESNETNCSKKIITVGQEKLKVDALMNKLFEKKIDAMKRSLGKSKDNNQENLSDDDDDNNNELRISKNNKNVSVINSEEYAFSSSSSSSGSGSFKSIGSSRRDEMSSSFNRSKRLKRDLISI